MPTSAKIISDGYQQARNAFSQAVKNQWSDKNLSDEQDVFGQRLSNFELLIFLIQHQIHHRGQMTILMRQAGLTVPGIYGPSKEEWDMTGREAPKM